MRNKILLLAAPLLLAACLEETIPTDAVTEEMVNASDNAIAAMLKALPGRFHAMGSNHYAFGYGAMMHIRDVQTGDMWVNDHNYDHFKEWERNTNMGSNSAPMQYIWNYYYQNIRACNNLLAMVPNHEMATDLQKAAIGAAYAFRALNYLDLARCYEFLPCDVYPTAVNGQGHSIEGLTVPIVTEFTTEESAQVTPRATREEMGQFILGDLDSAQVYIEYLDKSEYQRDYSMPHRYSVYGLKARLYMWMASDEHLEYYSLASASARNAVLIAGGAGHHRMFEYIFSENQYYTPVAVDQNNYVTLFSSFSTNGMFMWGATQTSDNATVQSGAVNWTSWMNPLAQYGYAAAGAYSGIDKRLYDYMSEGDWRRMMYAFGQDGFPDGMAVKFDVGSGNYDLPSVSAATTYPIMRMEEMDLIAAEAAAHMPQGLPQALTMLETFMQTSCDPDYKYKGEKTREAIVNEIVMQKRIELWGEGQSFFDIKRCNIPVERGYSGTSFASMTRFNTTTRPAWMNWVITLPEENTNRAVREYNNPDPSGRYTPWVE